MIQAVLFKNEQWQPQEAVRWLLENEHKADDMIITTYFTRFNQISTEELRKQGHTDFHNIDIGRGIHFVIASRPTNSINSNFR